MRVRLSEIDAVAAERPAGYCDALRGAGKVVGEWLDIDDEEVLRIKMAYGVGESEEAPTVAEMASNFVGAMTRWAARGFPTVERAEYEARLATCQSCEKYGAVMGGMFHGCGRCGCATLKLHLKSEVCPLAK